MSIAGSRSGTEIVPSHDGDDVPGLPWMSSKGYRTMVDDDRAEKRHRNCAKQMTG